VVELSFHRKIREEHEPWSACASQNLQRERNGASQKSKAPMPSFALDNAVVVIDRMTKIIRKRSVSSRISPRKIRELKMLRPFHRLHILRTFKRRGIGAAELAHAALHLADRFVFMVGHPCLQLPFDEMKMVASFP
jgi:hypothetical protein